MTDYKAYLLKLHNNLQILQEREAKYGGNTPLELVNQLDDHRQAVALTKQALNGELNEVEWHERLKPLALAFADGQVVNIEAQTYVAGDQHIHQAAAEPPFWQRLSRTNLILAIVFGFIATMAAVLAVPGVSDWVYGVFTPLPFAPAADGETLIVVAAFHETGATHTEPHVKIKRGIEAAAREAGLDNLRVELDPTVLTADQREQAETLGKRYNASLVIWGEDTGVEVRVNFLNLKQPNFAAAEVQISETGRAQLTNPSAYAQFITADLPAQLTFLSLFATGQSYYTQTKYPEAIKVIEKAVETLPAEVNLKGVDNAYFRLGWLYQTMGDLKPAIADYTQAIALKPDYAIAYINRGGAYYNSGDLEKAIADCTKAIQLKPDEAGAYINRGLAYSDSGNLKQAIADYTKAIQLKPDLADAYTNQGLAYHKSGDLEKAIADYTKAIQLKPDYAGAYNNRGLAYSDSGDLKQAIADYTQAIQLKPDYADAYTNRSGAYYASGDLEKAITDCTKSIQLKPDGAEAYNNRGNAYAVSGDLKQAIADYTQAIQLKPDNAEVYYNWGITYFDSGDLKQAIADYTQAIQLKPDYADAYNNRGFAYYNSGDLKQAIADYTQAIQLKPDDVLTYNNRGLAYQKSGDLKQAITDFERYLELSPNASNRAEVLKLIEQLKKELGQ